MIVSTLKKCITGYLTLVEGKKNKEVLHCSSCLPLMACSFYGEGQAGTINILSLSLFNVMQTSPRCAGTSVSSVMTLLCQDTNAEQASLSCLSCGREPRAPHPHFLGQASRVVFQKVKRHYSMVERRG